MGFAYSGFQVSYTRQMVGAIGQDIAMKKVIFLLLILAIGLGVFVAGALHLDRLEPLLLRLGIDPDHWIVEEALRAVGVVVIGAPWQSFYGRLRGLAPTPRRQTFMAIRFFD